MLKQERKINMKITSTMALAAILALAAAPTAGAQTFHGDGYPGYSRGWQSRAVALPQGGPSAAEEAQFDRASRTWDNG